jgi:hypothetical protein
MNRYFNVLILTLAVALLASFPAGAAERPFSLNGGGTVAPNGVINGSGRATHLGLYTEAGQLNFVPDPNNPARVLASGTATFTAANGDQLDIVIENGALDLTTGEGSGDFRAVGGTGRFADASGGGSFVLTQNLVTGAFEITAVGNLDY